MEYKNASTFAGTGAWWGYHFVIAGTFTPNNSAIAFCRTCFFIVRTKHNCIRRAATVVYNHIQMPSLAGQAGRPFHIRRLLFSGHPVAINRFEIVPHGDGDPTELFTGSSHLFRFFLTSQLRTGRRFRAWHAHHDPETQNRRQQCCCGFRAKGSNNSFLTALLLLTGMSFTSPSKIKEIMISLGSAF